MSGQGVREGLAARLYHETRRRPAPRCGAAARGPAARFDGWSADRADRRAALAMELLRALDCGPPPSSREALTRPRRLLDIGRTVDFFDRHEHVADLVLATDLAGFSHRQVALLAAVVAGRGRDEARPGSSRPS